MFTKKGYIVIRRDKADEDTLMAAVLDAGADDLRDDGDSWEVLIGARRVSRRPRSGRRSSASSRRPRRCRCCRQNYLKLEGKQAQQMLKLMDVLDDHDDVQHVWSNFDIDEKEIEASLA